MSNLTFKFYFKLLLASLELIKNDDTYLMSQEESIAIFHGQMPSVEFSSFGPFKSIASIAVVESVVHLIFIQIDSRKVFMFTPNSEKDQVQKQFLKNWR